MLRDKIDTFVDFPIEGLDLEAMVGEREVAKRLQSQGFDISSLGLGDLDEPLVYDLYAVDEHLGGLGGGHYRAYAFNHITKKWYHFDDSFVTEATADQSVVSRFYRFVTEKVLKVFLRILTRTSCSTGGGQAVPSEARRKRRWLPPDYRQMGCGRDQDQKRNPSHRSTLPSVRRPPNKR